MKSHVTKGCLLVVLMISLIGCGGRTGQAEGPDAPNVLHITRNSLPSYHIVSLNMVFHDGSQVQNLYHAAYALAKVPSQGVSNCPIDIGLEYSLEFLHDTISTQTVTLDATGCRHLDLNTAGFNFIGIDTHDVRLTTPAFRELLAKMLHLSSLSPPLI